MRLTMSLNRVVVLVALGVIGAGLARAADPAPATAPSTRPATTKPSGPPFPKEIEALEAADRKNPPAPGGVLFLGSSSIVKWKTLAQDFPGVPVVNRGFGGSTIPDTGPFPPPLRPPPQTRPPPPAASSPPTSPA